MTIEDRVSDIRRRSGDVCLIAVSKGHSADAIRDAYAAGMRDFGENYVQEFVDKASELSDLVDIRWHFMGQLQRNKMRHLVGRTYLIHTLAKASHLERISRLAQELGMHQRVLLQVNLTGETQKSGCTADVARELLDCAKKDSLDDGVEIQGLMTMGHTPSAEPGTENTSTKGAKHVFRALVALRDGMRTDGAPLETLSMGMSGDFEEAIACGSTMIRVGSAIFGPRNSG